MGRCPIFLKLVELKTRELTLIDEGRPFDTRCPVTVNTQPAAVTWE